MGFGMKTHDQSVNIPITSSHPALQYPRVLFAQVFKACTFHDLSVQWDTKSERAAQSH